MVVSWIRSARGNVHFQKDSTLPTRGMLFAAMRSLLSALKPSESLTQLVSGLIVVLTFTLAASVATRVALLGAIGANAANAIINAVIYIMNSAFERNRQLRIARVIASNPDEDAALAAIRNEFDPYIASVTQHEDREELYRSVRNSLVHGRMPKRTEFLRDDIIGAVAVFCLTLAATIPAILPLLIIDHPWVALRVSNFLVIGSLFFAGYHWAKYVDAKPWLAGLGLTILGLVLVAVAIALGG
jgi:VIT1/CCC1 family predicted Fe2+/Mn2+ transporter